MIIDSHQHVFWHGLDDAGLVADMDACGVDLAWLLTWEIHPDEDRPDRHGILNPLHARDNGTHGGIPLSDLITARNNYPDRFILGYCPHPAVGDAPSLLEAAYRTHGVRVCGEFKHRVLMDDPRSLNLLRKAGELGCPVVLHLDVPFLPGEKVEREYQPNWYGGTVENLERALQACPDTVFVGHAPGFWREISGDAGCDGAQYPRGPISAGGRVQVLLEKYANLYADLSAGSGLYALQRDTDHARKFLVQFADRLLFARDGYGNDLKEYLDSLDLPPEIYKKIFSQNAQRLVQL